MARFILRYGKVILGIYALVGVLLAVPIDTHGDTGYLTTSAVLSLPLGLIFLGCYVWLRRHEEWEYYCATTAPRRQGSSSLGYPLFICYLMVLGIAGFYFIAANALFPARGSVTYQGPVVGQFIRQGKNKCYVVDILDEATRQLITLNVSREEYGALKPSVHYQRTYTIGFFGRLYRWRWDE